MGGRCEHAGGDAPATRRGKENSARPRGKERATAEKKKELRRDQAMGAEGKLWVEGGCSGWCGWREQQV
eukprot:scaffold12837_cov121-Isochrysis_galbana.AAC.1